ncbi:integrator complex assembly factor WDR73 [Genypterus blacodes]|uniref:integrator complex assembly factor WDR73 n=1 Tax=Genypterus blacodes TaxID=154954 RepID=UPI003F75E318
MDAAERGAVRGDEEEEEDVLDDWFIESLKTYTDLHVFQLERLTRVIEWTSARSVCVAGCSSTSSELLELHLPLKLFAEENKGLCAQRDFKVLHGGFTDGPVLRLTHVPGTRCVATNDGRSSTLQLWQLGGDDSDVIRRTGSVEGKSASGAGSRMAARRSADAQILHGARTCDIQLTDVSSGRSLYTLETTASDPLSCLQFVSDSVFLAGCCNGNIHLVDTRMSTAALVSPSPPSSETREPVLWWTDASTGPSSPDGAGCSVVRLNSLGRALVSDVRNQGAAVCQAQLDVGTDRSNLDDVRVSWAPALDDCLSVSGFSGVVQIYSTSCWTSELKEARPLFEHRGHAVSCERRPGSPPLFITSHTWHPHRARTLLSAASDGSVHLWDWVDQSAAQGPSEVRCADRPAEGGHSTEQARVTDAPLV